MRALHFPALAALSVGLLCGGSAQAARSSLTVNHLHIQLIDLDESDGIAPALSFSNGSTSLSYFRADLSHYIEASTSVPSLNAMLGPLQAGDNHGTQLTQSFGGALVSTQGWSGEAWVSNFGGPVTAWSSVTLSAAFSLTAHTLLLVSAEVPVPKVYADDGDVSIAESVLHVADADDSTQGYSRTYLSVDHGQRSHLGSDRLQASFVNLADRPVEGSFLLRLLASATNNSYVSTVPEPHGAALLLTGLAALGEWLRRRGHR